MVPQHALRRSRSRTSRSSPVRFSKLQGAGNDFVLLDTLVQPLPDCDLSELARRLCDRRFGVGADGILLVEPSTQADYRMRILNADGSEATMCGNGIRCMARYLLEQYHPEADHLTIETGAGIRVVFRAGENLLTVQVGRPRVLDPKPELSSLLSGISAAAVPVDTGAPHLVLLVDDVDTFPLETLGPALETHPAFPERTNVSVAQVLRADDALARVWERGAGATLACGTGACAIVVAGAHLGRMARRAMVRMPGGTLQVEWRADDTLWLTGDAVWVFEGVWRAPL